MDHMTKAPMPAIMGPKDIGLTAVAEIEQISKGLPHGKQRVYDHIKDKKVHGFRATNAAHLDDPMTEKEFI
eukprot:12907744-Prorocentrum_lima.AAC.1